jgi:chromosomal replication initiator protein
VLPEGMASAEFYERYLFSMKEAAAEAFGRPLGIRLLFPGELAALRSEQTKKEEAETSSFFLNPRYTFSTFVTGSNNRFAHAAALAVAESPSCAYNPLFLYGGSGLGKTHLMHAIGHYILQNHPDKKILYISSESFVNEFIQSLRNKQNIEFRQKYRNIDVLLIDDIQFIEGKDSTQEEIFHTFNTLYSSNKQIIISSDRPPKDLSTLDSRLRSRFECGLTADIQPPEFETRVAILQKKAELDHLPQSPGLQEAFFIIAEKIKYNIRELEGALNRIVAYSKLTGEEIDGALVQKVLTDIFPSGEQKVTPENIKQCVSSHFKIKLTVLDSSRRTRQLAYPRQIAMYLCREMTELSLPKIGEAFGGKDHTTVLHACNKIASELKQPGNHLQLVLEEIQNEILK